MSLVSDSYTEPFAVWPPRQVIRATLTVLAVTLGFWLAFKLWSVLFLAFIAIVLATALKPSIDRAQRAIGNRFIAVGLVYTIALGLLTAVLIKVAPMLAEEVLTVVGNLPGQYDGLRSSLLESHNRLLTGLANGLPESFPKNLGANLPLPGDVETLSKAFGYLGTFVWAFLAALVTLLLAVYWSLDGDRSQRTMLMLLPPERRETTREVLVEIEAKVGAYIRGQSLLCLVVGVLAIVAYSIIGLPQALALGFIVGLFEVMPVFGPILGAVPALLTALTVSPSVALWVLVANTTIQQLENYVLVPRVMEGSVGVNPIVTLLAIVGFGALFGPLGAVMAIPLAAVVQTLVNRFLLNAGAAEQVVSNGRTRLSRLRYDTQELMRDVRKQVRNKDDGANLIDEMEEAVEGIAMDLDDALAKADSGEQP